MNRSGDGVREGMICCAGDLGPCGAGGGGTSPAFCAEYWDM